MSLQLYSITSRMTPSRPGTPASSIGSIHQTGITGLMRRPRVRHSRQSSTDTNMSNLSEDRVMRSSSRSQRRSGVAADLPFAAPKSRRVLPGERAHPESALSYSRAPSSAYTAIQHPRPGHAFRASLQSLARAGSFSLLKTPKARDSDNTQDYISDEDDYSADDSRFSIPDDPFRSEAPITILDIEDTPTRRPLQIRPPSQLIIPDYASSPDPTPTSEEPQTPTTASITAMKNTLNRMATTGKSRMRLLSFIKEVRSPISAEPPTTSSPPKLQLPSFAEEEPLFDASKFEVPDVSFKKRKSRVQLATPKLAIPPPPPVPPAVARAPPKRAKQAPDIDTHGDFEAYSIFSGNQSAFRVGQKPQSSEPPGWIAKFREELEQLAGEVLNMTAFEDRLVLDLPTDDGGSHRRTLLFQGTGFEEVEEFEQFEDYPGDSEGLQFHDEPEMVYPITDYQVPAFDMSRFRETEFSTTPELSSDSGSFLGRPRRPTRELPPVPMDLPEIPGSRGVSVFAESTWSPPSIREACLSFTSLQTNTTFDPDQPIPTIPDSASYISFDEDDHTIRAATSSSPPASPPPTFIKFPSKQQAIEEAIRKIQRKAQESSLRVTELQGDDTESEGEPIKYKPPTVTPTVLKRASSPFSLSSDGKRLARPKPLPAPPPPKPAGKVSSIRKRLLSRSLIVQRNPPEPPSPVSANNRESRRIVIAGRLPLREYPVDRALPSLPPSDLATPALPNFNQQPLYLASSTPTFEVVSIPKLPSNAPIVYYPVDPEPLSAPLPYPHIHRNHTTHGYQRTHPRHKHSISY